MTTLSSYEKILHFLFSKRSSARHVGIESAKRFSKALEQPERSFRSIHIAGTNGKGSVSYKIAKSLEKGGYKVGLFTSPHIECYRERIQINGCKIPEDEVEMGMLRLLEVAEKVDPDVGFFDLTTFLAFCYFQKEEVDIAVIETGIGGLLDITNIIFPLVSVITSIGQDHKEVLGPTIEDIARQKAGIIKPFVPVVVGPSASLPVVREIAYRQEAPLYSIPSIPGFYDRENTAIAREALSLLSSTFPLSLEEREEGCLMRPSCRFEKVGKRVILDVAHNPDGFNRLIEALTEFYPHTSFSFVVGMSKEKDIKASLSYLLPKASHIYVVATSSSRTASPSYIASILEELSFFSYTVAPSLSQGLDLAWKGESPLVICGSFFLMQEAKEWVFRREEGQ